MHTPSGGLPFPALQLHTHQAAGGSKMLIWTPGNGCTIQPHTSLGCQFFLTQQLQLSLPYGTGKIRGMSQVMHSICTDICTAAVSFWAFMRTLVLGRPLLSSWSNPLMTPVTNLLPALSPSKRKGEEGNIENEGEKKRRMRKERSKNCAAKL